MSNLSKITKQDVENKNNKDLSKGTSSENLEYFKRALAEAIELKKCKNEEEMKFLDVSME